MNLQTYQYHATTLASLRSTEVSGMDLSSVYGQLQPSQAVNSTHTQYPTTGVQHAASGVQYAAGHAQYANGGFEHATGDAQYANYGVQYASGGVQYADGSLSSGAFPASHEKPVQHAFGGVQYTASASAYPVSGFGSGHPHNTATASHTAATASHNAATASQPPYHPLPVPPSHANGQVSNPGFGSGFASQFEPLPASRFQQASRSASPTGSGSSQPRDPRLHPTYNAEGSQAFLVFPAPPAAFLTQPVPVTNPTSQNQDPESFGYDSFGMEIDFDMILGMDQNLDQGTILDQDPDLFKDLDVNADWGSDGTGGLLMPDLQDSDILAYHQSLITTDFRR